MKNHERFDALWRDNPLRLCAYGVLFAVVLISLQYHLIINPRQQEISALTHSLGTLRAQTMPDQTTIQKNNIACAWEKTQPIWVLSGSFAYVYDCLLHSVPNQQQLNSVQLKKHVLGISATIRFHPENEQ